MKKIFMLVLLVVFIGISSGAFAMDFMVGAKAGYFAWNPYLADTGSDGSFADIGWGTGVLYGPIFSLIFTPEISLSVSGLLGRQSTYWNSRFTPNNFNQNITGNYSFDVFRADFDSVLIYRLGTNFRIFAGYKYQYLKSNMELTELRTNSSTGVIEEIHITSYYLNNYSHGPAAGFGYSYPISNTFFAAITLSGVFMWGEFSLETSEDYELNGSVLEKNPDSSFSGKPMHIMGINIEPTIGMSAGAGMPIITLGIRYQHLRIKIYEVEGMLPDKWFDDKLVGIFISAVYMF